MAAEFPCVVCCQPVLPDQHALQCDQCHHWQHRVCNTEIASEMYLDIVSGKLDLLSWYCTNCRVPGQTVVPETSDGEENPQQQPVQAFQRAVTPETQSNHQVTSNKNTGEKTRVREGVPRPSAILPSPHAANHLPLPDGPESSHVKKSMMPLSRMVQEVRELYLGKEHPTGPETCNAMSPRVILIRLTQKYIQKYTSLGLVKNEPVSDDEEPWDSEWTGPEWNMNLLEPVVEISDSAKDNSRKRKRMPDGEESRKRGRPQAADKDTVDNPVSEIQESEFINMPTIKEEPADPDPLAPPSVPEPADLDSLVPSPVPESANPDPLLALTGTMPSSVPVNSTSCSIPAASPVAVPPPITMPVTAPLPKNSMSRIPIVSLPVQNRAPPPLPLYRVKGKGGVTVILPSTRHPLMLQPGSTYTISNTNNLRINQQQKRNTPSTSDKPKNTPDVVELRHSTIYPANNTNNMVVNQQQKGNAPSTSDKSKDVTYIKPEEPPMENVFVMPFGETLNTEESPPKKHPTPPDVIRCETPGETARKKRMAAIAANIGGIAGTVQRRQKDLAYKLVDLNNKYQICESRLEKIKEAFKKRLEAVEAEKEELEQEIDSVLASLQEYNASVRY